MPRNPKSKLADLPVIAPELLTSFGNGPMTAEAINAASLAFKKALIEKIRCQTTFSLQPLPKM